MLVNALVTALVGTYIAIAIYGHVLLITALWPNLFRKRSGPIIRVGERQVQRR